MLKVLKIPLILLRDIHQQRYFIFSMARRQIERQFVGSFLGFFWTFINPLVMIFIFWFVFSYGLKTRPLGEIPFAVWLTAGIAIWVSFNEIVTGSANIIIENQSLLKKTKVLAHVLPISKIITSLIPHLIMLAILIVLMFFYNIPLSLYIFQFIYYLFSMYVLALGLGWLVASLNVFIRDTAQMVNVIMQFLFWLTPIMWDVHIMPKEIHGYLKLNPIYYVVQGYRDSFFYQSPFWSHYKLTLYYWTLSLIFFIVGGIIFKKMRPHFADVL